MGAIAHPRPSNGWSVVVALRRYGQCLVVPHMMLAKKKIILWEEKN